MCTVHCFAFVTSFCLILKVLAVLAGRNIARGCTILEIEKIETIIAALALIERAYATIVYATHFAVSVTACEVCIVSIG